MTFVDMSISQSAGQSLAMPQRGILSVELEINVSADRAWAAVKDLPNVLPRLMPQLLQEVIITQGNGGVGSIREVRVPAGPFTRPHLYAEAVIDVIDDTSRTEIHRIIGGKMRNFYSFYRCTKSFTPAKDGKSCIATWTVEYEPVIQGKVEASKQSVYAILYALEDFLLKNDAYLNGL
ncbi:unnamed protein product [Calypogeia fissa]